MGAPARPEARRHRRAPLVAPRARPTETKTRILAGGLHTRRQQMLRLDRGRDGRSPPRSSRELAPPGRRARAGAPTPCSSPTTAAALVERGHRRGPAPPRRSGRAGLRRQPLQPAQLRRATGCKPNEPELARARRDAPDTDGGLESRRPRARREVGAEALRGAPAGATGWPSSPRPRRAHRAPTAATSGRRHRRGRHRRRRAARWRWPPGPASTDGGAARQRRRRAQGAEGRHGHRLGGASSAASSSGACTR